MGDSPDDEQTPESPGWREPMGAFGLVVALLVAVSLVSTVWAPLADHILAVAAVVFISTPFIILRRRNADFHRFGIDLESIPVRHVLLGLGVTAVVFPLYAAGHHVWETAVQDRQFNPDVDNYRQWPVELDAPPLLDGDRSGIQIRTVDNRLLVQWDHTDQAGRGLVVDADRPFVWDRAPGFSVGPAPADSIGSPERVDPAEIELAGPEVPEQTWYVEPSVPDGSGQLVLSRVDQPEQGELPRRMTLRVVDPAGPEQPQVWVGAESRTADEPVEIERTHWWLVIWALTHLVLVALPEEYFYRGYLQTRLDDLFGDTEADEPTTFLGFSRANWATSGLFAIGHVLIPVGGTFSVGRAAVFFPSLLFGWLKERTGSIIAPTIFHAGANMMVLVAAVHYF